MVKVTPLVKSFSVSFTPSQELDVVGYLIHATTTLDVDSNGDGVDDDFLPSAQNLINIGPETSFYIQAAPTTHYVKIAAYDTFEDQDNIQFGSLNYTAAIPVTVLSIDSLDVVPPAVPTGLALTTSVPTTGDSGVVNIKATWNANTEDDLSGYSLQLRHGDSEGYVQANVFKDTTSFQFEGLEPNAQYSVRIAAYDTWGNVSAFTSWVTITSAVDTIPPDAPTSVAISAGFDSIGVVITANKPADWLNFEIQVATNSAFTTGVSTGSTTATITSFPVAQGTYYVRARSNDTSGNHSAWTLSTPASVATAIVIPDTLYNELKAEALINNVLFRFGRAGDTTYPTDTTLYVVSTGGSIIWKNVTYALATTALPNAYNSYIVAACVGNTATLSVMPYTTDLLALPTTSIVIAVTSPSKLPDSNGNYICYVRNANSIEVEGAIIRNATITTAQIKNLNIGDAVVTGTLNAARLNVSDLFADQVTVVSGNKVTALKPGAITTGTLSATTEVTVGTDGSSAVKLSGVNRRLEVRKTGESFDRVQIGQLLDGSYGIDIKNASGQSIFLSPSGNLDGAKISNLTVTGDQVVGGTLVIGSSSTIAGVNAGTVVTNSSTALSTANTANSTANTAYSTANSAYTVVNGWTKPGYTLIDGNKIYTGDAYVDTLQIKGQAVTIPANLWIPYAQVWDSETWRSPLDFFSFGDISISGLDGCPVAIFISFIWDYFSYGAAFRLRRTNLSTGITVEVFQRESFQDQVYDNVFSMTISDTPPAGDYQYHIGFLGNGYQALTVYYLSLVLLGVKR